MTLLQVLYAGHDTKAMLNNSGPRSKRSKLERAMNSEIIKCWLMLFVMCGAGGFGNGIWTSTFDLPVARLQFSNANSKSQTTLWYPWYPGITEPSLHAFYNFWSYFILLQARECWTCPDVTALRPWCPSRCM